MPLKKPFILAAFLFSSFLSQATAFDERYGIGTVHIIPYNFFSLDFYSHTDDTAPFDQVSFSKDKQSDDLHFQFATSGADTAPSWFVPEYFNTSAEKIRIEMCCLEKQDDWCKVLLNSGTGLTKWIHLGADVVYYDWNDFFISTASVEIISGDPKLFAKPSHSSNSQPLLTKSEAGETQLIQVQQVDGVWMQVKVIRFNNNMEQVSNTEGWILWRDDAGLFIGYNLYLD